MAGDKYTRREFLSTVVRATACGGLSALAINCGILNRERTELGDTLSSEGVVISKEFYEGGYLNPFDNVNPLAAADAIKQSTKYPDEYKVKILCGRDTVIANDKNLYERVTQGTRVNVEYKQRFRVTRDYDGNVIKREPRGFVVQKTTLE